MSQPTTETGARPIVHTGVTVLEVDSAELMSRIAELVDLAPFTLARISDRELVIEPAKTGELSDLLEAHGLAPLVRKAR